MSENTFVNTSVHTSIAIVGSGFSGTMTAINLIQMLPSNHQTHITLIEKSGIFAQGVAYSTQDPYHLLNVRAIRMGAFSDNPEHFYQWTQEHENLWKQYFPALTVHPEDYVPRKLYALYLHFLFEQAKQEAKNKHITLLCLSNEAIAAIPIKGDQLKITLNNDRSLITNFLVLATNFQTSQNIQIDPNLPPGHYIDNIWNLPYNSFLSLSDFSHLKTNSRIVIVGSGLTMVDAAVTLIKKGYPGEILAISKHGHLPEPHHEKIDVPPPNALHKYPIQLLPLFKYVKEECIAAEKKGVDWRAIIDSLRPFAVSLWEALSLNDKKRFVRHVLSFWNKYRHRIPPSSFKIIQTHQQNGKLRVIKGNVKALHKSNKQISVETNQSIIADYVLNCSGPQLNIKKTTNPLLKNLLQNELVTPDPLNMGISVDDHYKVIGKINCSIYAMGQLLTGQKLETVAVPELRNQCAHIAKEICSYYEIKVK